jgi:hypothetical protein
MENFENKYIFIEKIFVMSYILSIFNLFSVTFKNLFIVHHILIIIL